MVKKTIKIAVFIIVITLAGSFLLLKNKRISEADRFNLPNSFDEIKDWTTSTMPNTNLHFGYRPLRVKDGLAIGIEPYTQDGLRIFAKAEDINVLLRKGAALQDQNVVAEYCMYPSFNIIIHPANKNKTLVDFIKSEMSSNGYYNNEYASKYGLFSSINGREIFFYKITEDKSFRIGFVYTDNGIAEIMMPLRSPCVYLGDETVKKFGLNNFIDEYNYFSDFDFIDILKSVAYLN